MNRFVFTYSLLVFVSMLWISCTQQPEPVSVKVPWMRFDQDLFDTGRTAPNAAHFQRLEAKYGEFITGFSQDILQIRDDGNPEIRREELTRFIEFPGIQLLKKDIDSVFSGGLTSEQSQLEEAFGRFKAYYPDKKIPKIVTYLSEFSIGNVTMDSTLGIGLDFYLGKNYAIYPAIGFPKYMSDKLSREYIVPNTLKTFGIGLYDGQLKDKRFIAYMLFEGKIRYFIHQLAPTLPDTLLLGISSKQLAWDKQNEAEIWAHYLDKKILYSDEPPRYMRYLNDGPFTTAEGVPQESAPAIGVYTGYRIIQQYAEKSGQNLPELMAQTDWDKILKISEYRPK